MQERAATMIKEMEKKLETLRGGKYTGKSIVTSLFYV